MSIDCIMYCDLQLELDETSTTRQLNYLGEQSKTHRPESLYTNIYIYIYRERGIRTAPYTIYRCLMTWQLATS